MIYDEKLNNEYTESGKERQVILWGYSANFDQIKTLLEAININIIAFIDINNRMSTENVWENTPLISPEEIPKNIPIICAFIGDSEEEKNLFSDCLNFCRQRGYRFLHPVFILPELQGYSTTISKIKTYGIQGSGNVLLQDFIFDCAQFAKQPSAFDILFRHIASHYRYFAFNAIKRIKGTFFSEDNQEFVAWSPINYIYSAFEMINEKIKKRFVISVPDFLFAITNIITDHTRVTKKSIKFYQGQNFKCTFIMRNPIDVLFSILNKVDILEYDKDDRFTAYFAFYVKNYMQEALKNINDLHVIKYEDLCYRTEETLREFCDYIGITVSDEFIKKWKEKALFKQLPKAPERHFTGGGKQRWKGYFTKKTLKLFKEMGLITLAEQMGYDVSEEDFTETRSYQIKPSSSPMWLKKSQLNSSLYSILWGADSYQKKIKTQIGIYIYYYENSDVDSQDEFDPTEFREFADIVDSCFYEKPNFDLFYRSTCLQLEELEDGYLTIEPPLMRRAKFLDRFFRKLRYK
ncbi:sulfotransferase domain-containing protein [Coxiella burnetii]|uniref:sulfotransferase domain-containing protein n=1 Tax=Coxiella burnetii TaxID=777 RepID=UPI000183CF96|nr:sulfotransferase domain-containing protein [Coxiella burnetii]ACJ18617.1 sulfotransferase [Coxiella burnetii CbuG_Q212]ATN66999.1 sulfotransferase [Coxiella burnetii]OYK85985.1 sulfotransferase [Coxiella burnetii]